MAPTTSTKPLILVTGATGMIGFRSLVLALQAGNRARIVYRRAGQPEKIKATKSIQPFLNEIEFVQITDITAPNAFVNAAKDVDYILHIASPVFDLGEKDAAVQRDWQTEFYDPAVQGTLCVLDAALGSSTIKRVVITGSVIALEPKEGTKVAGPTDLRALPPADFIKNAPNPGMAYIFSKVLSHSAVNDWVKQHPKIHFDVVRVLPGFTQGPNELLTPADIASISSASTAAVLNAALGEVTDVPMAGVQVHLEDVARAHVVAMDGQKVKGGDVLICVANNGVGWRWDEVAEIAKQVFPEEVKAGVLSPKPGQADMEMAFDVTETYAALETPFKSMEEMVKDVVGQWLEFKGQQVKA
ncbi:hypothetical protein LTR97_006087 [Elasticomyces elasticus]|uniref:NAD-dependent epimerase/dehydratase domain-containing protein n=1 Tax=Elasticomyces elasticus TaxID=574655 RepID=A0AAN8A303_9PEZI|nr:hypothetical protein LTR97_006087 [Elasticomyces elasticus]KAK5716710.1 hypothetical protein LTR15_009602 [Elasticomyces elasticus]